MERGETFLVKRFYGLKLGLLASGAVCVCENVQTSQLPFFRVPFFKGLIQSCFWESMF